MTLLLWGLLAIAVALRLLPRLVWARFMGTDHHFHSYYARLIRANGHRLPDAEPRIVGGPNECTYPALYHAVLSYLPDAGLAWMDRYSGLLFDLVTAAVLAGVLVRTGGLEPALVPALIGLYLLAPALTFSTVGPRAFSLTPRNFSQAAFGLASAAVFLAADEPGVQARALEVLATVLLAVSLLSAQFAEQAVLFILLPAAAFLRDPAPAYLALASFALAAVISRGFFVTQVRAHLEHLEWYHRCNQWFVSHRGRWSKLWEGLRARSPGQVWHEVAFYNPMLVGCVRHTTHLAAVAAAAWTGVSGSTAWAFAISAGCLVPWVITTIGPFRILGEADRYLEFGFAAQWYLVWRLVPAPWRRAAIGALAIYSLCWYAYNLRVIRIQMGSHGVDHQRELASWIGEDPAQVLLALSNNESYFLLRHTPVRLVGFLVNLTLRAPHEGWFDWFFHRYPFVHPDHLREMLQRYGVSLVLCNKGVSRQFHELTGRSYDFADLELVRENDVYALYRVPAALREPA